MATNRIATLTKRESKELLMLSVNGKLKSYTPRKIVKQSDRNYQTIEIAGMPRSFKSTLILGTIFNLRTYESPAHFIQERIIRIDKRLNPTSYSLSIATKSIESLLYKTKNTVYLLDRCVYDQLAFLYTQRKHKLIDRKSYELASKYLVRVLGKHIDSLIICTNTPQISLKRDMLRVKPGTGYVMNNGYLTTLQNAYKKLPKIITDLRKSVGLARKPFPIITLDSTESWKTYHNLFQKSAGTFLHLGGNTTH